jgi:ribosomal protein S27E
MQPITCPNCGYESSFDPWAESAHCTACGYLPGGPGVGILAPDSGRADSHYRYLDELLALWTGTHVPDRDAAAVSFSAALGFYRQYQKALGAAMRSMHGGRAAFVPTYRPERGEILAFVQALRLLRRGNTQAAAKTLGRLTRGSPEFVDPWVWLSATTEDTDARIRYLSEALAREPAHPLARDAMAMARGRVSAATTGDSRTGPQALRVECPNCGGAPSHQASSAQVVCSYCGSVLDIDPQPGPRHELISDLRLRRRKRAGPWAAAEHTLLCRGCGAELVVANHLAAECAFCGSRNVRIEDRQGRYQEPDGFLPFVLDQMQASEAVQRACRLGQAGLRAMFARTAVELGQVRAVYLPFWLFAGFVEATMAGARANTVPTLLQASNQPLRTRDLIMVRDILFSAVERPAPGMTRRLLPYPLASLVPYEPHLLGQWPAALYTKDVEALLPSAHEQMIDRARRESELAKTLSSSDSEIGLARSYHVLNVSFQLVLLPVWTAALCRGEESCIALVNGQTGKVAVESRLLDGEA